MSEVTVSAKDKKKDRTDRDKWSQNRLRPDKEKEEIEEATRKSLKAERKAAKAKAKEEKQLAEVLEQSRLEAERRAKELQALSSKPIVPTPLLVLGKQNLSRVTSMEIFLASPQLCLALSTPTTPSIKREPRLLLALIPTIPFSLSGKQERNWRSQLKRVREIISNLLQDVLQLVSQM